MPPSKTTPSREYTRAMRTRVAVLFLFLLVFATVAVRTQTARPAQGPTPPPSAANQIVDPHDYQDLRWRAVGPTRGGRVTAIAGVRTQPCTFYMGASGGGVFKTDNCGDRWTPVTDGQIQDGSI